ncbi:fatty acyl-AMP ligase [Streptomyces sp. A3M-1-3]|uniref:fatty acyl-AMP ligase n=1 Tax=Streptomyces sp. A3M-1-3 TaxID=2962044 RepID=UPI0020B66A7A|nr:fatty acyl-AMP ligase [Streptomyces sp. A3M-1-3]MCP3821626.1 fatty acyl-AMP ligase [Streptomyces sp. A3M-1-3]
MSAPGRPAPPGLFGGDLVSLVRRHADTAGEAPAFTFVDYASDRRGRSRGLSYRQLDRLARSAAAELRRYAEPGDRVALAAPQGLEYLVGFLGCLYAGLIAVPLHAPDAYHGDDRLLAVLEDCDPACLLTIGEYADATAALGLRATGRRLPVVETDLLWDRADDDAEARETPGTVDVDPVEVGPEAVAYLQYTSGSTRRPRGVVVSHANLLAAAVQSAVQSQLHSSDVIVSWLPYFHDMGLITGVAMPLSAGAHAVHLSPMAFVQRPLRWLQLISDHRATWTAAPNFALDLTVRRVSAEQRAGLRLDSLHTLCNGAEQVRSLSVEAFSRAFAPCGFTLSGHAPGYGLAEATLGVTTALDGALVRSFDRDALAGGRVVPVAPNSPQAWDLVGCGVPMPGVSVAVTDPDTGRERPMDRTGEIWVSGPNVARGYWGRPEASAESFGAVLTEAGGARTEPVWLRTGDLGFIHEGQLFLAGRSKELIVVDGRNHYPADLEATVEEALAALSPAATAAFSVDGGSAERLVVAVELRRAPHSESLPARAESVAVVRRAVSAQHGVDVADVLFLRPGTVPRTSSGKVRRRACADRYTAGSLHTDLSADW